MASDADRFASCTVENYARHLQLPLGHLKQLHCKDTKHKRAPAVAIPYYDQTGRYVTTALCIAFGFDGPDEFRSSDKKANWCLYGANKLRRYRKDVIALVEGEPAAMILWHQHIQAVGIPSESAWDEKRDAALLAEFIKIYVVIDGSDRVFEWLQASAIRDRAWLISLPDGLADLPAWYQQAPEQFASRWQQAIDVAIPYSQHLEQERYERRQQAKQRAGALLHHPNILDEVAKVCHDQLGLVGEEQLLKSIYLCMTSRLFDKPVSEFIKGVSAAGKSYMVLQQAELLFPKTAYYIWTSASEKTLIYTEKSFKHRMVIFTEAAGMSEFLFYLIRTLQSEGQLRYETVVRNDKGEFVTQEIIKEGPVGVIVTTTETSLHPENETRCLSLTADDSPDQTKAIMLEQGRRAGLQTPEPDLDQWQALQEFLELSPNKVEIHYGEWLAKKIPPVAVRLRRDFPKLLSMIQANAFLHQATRPRNRRTGAVIALADDYLSIREQLSDLFAEGVEFKVSQAAVETRAAVAKLLQRRDAPDDGGAVSISQITKALSEGKKDSLDRSAVRRRVYTCLDLGLLQNIETRSRRLRIILGDEVPKNEESLLPGKEPVFAALEKNELVEIPPDIPAEWPMPAEMPVEE